MSLKDVFDNLAESEPEAGHLDWNTFCETHSAELFNMILSGDSSGLTELVGVLAPAAPTSVVNEATQVKREFVWPLGGRMFIDNNERNGWGAAGPVDDTNNQDLGDSQAADITRASGGLCFPWDVKINAMYVNWYAGNANVRNFGFFIARQVKNSGSNTVTTSFVLDQVADNGGVGPIDPTNTQNQITDIILTEGNIVPANETIVVGVDAPSASGTDNYANIMSGYLLLERLN